MKNTSILSLMKDMLIGKELKYCKSWKQVNQAYNVLAKKHNGVTQKQLDGGNPRFVKVIERTKTIGIHSIFETSKIVYIRVSYGDWDGGNSLILDLENGASIDLEVDSEMIEIEPNVIMIK